MQVMAIPAPVESCTSRFGTSPRLFLAVSEEVAACTHREDDQRGYAAPGQASVWVGLPVAREVLLAAWMVQGMGLATTAHLARMAADRVRELALHSLLYAGSATVQRLMGGTDFTSGYRTRGTELADYFTLLSERVDEAFDLGRPDPCKRALRAEPGEP
jgi:hypothetical protein